jgi:hypothetical protein
VIEKKTFGSSAADAAARRRAIRDDRNHQHLKAMIHFSPIPSLSNNNIGVHRYPIGKNSP